MPSAKKVQVVADLQEKAKGAKSVAFARYAGMNVKLQQQLRRAVREAGGEIVIAKNRLVDVALGRPEGLAKHMEEQLMTLFSYRDEVSALKALVKFSDENELPVVTAGVFENKVLDQSGIKALAATPGKEELIGTLLRTLQGPGFGLRNVLEAGPRNLVYALNAIKEKKQ